MNQWSPLRHQAQGGQVHIDGGRTGSSAGRRPTKLLGQIYINLPSVDERWYRWGMLGVYCGRCLPNWMSRSCCKYRIQLEVSGVILNIVAKHVLPNLTKCSDPCDLATMSVHGPIHTRCPANVIARTIDYQTTPSKTHISCQLHVSQENHSMVLGCFRHGLLFPEFCLVSTLRPVVCCIGCFGGLRRIHACASQLERA